ncbi:sugar ABC transporter ATP-binding protein [candidate division KSB1 bacterium]|nr:sugar ABC transporter ATP-binding protein [candidate division KSB1 bacterium]
MFLLQPENAKYATRRAKLEMQHIHKVFPGVVALDDVQFELWRGEVHILLGENGAGKSTLVKILSGAFPMNSGQILLDGEEIHIKNPRHAQTLGISTIYQELNLVPQLSVGENIFLGREPMVAPGLIQRKNLYKEAQRILDGLNIAIDARTPVRNLSIAHQQMVEVAKALSLNAKILIMDEPTSALTDQEIHCLFDIIHTLKQRGVSIIYISHRMDELFEIGDRVTILRDGKYIGTRTITDTTRAELIRMMVNREVKEQYPKQKAVIGEQVLRVEELNRKDVLKDISFSLNRGEILAFAGLLGSGRTELARAIFAADPIDSGRIFIHGKLVKIKKPRSAINHKMGFLTEDRKSQGLILNLSVKENICLASLDRFSRMGVVNTSGERTAADHFIKTLRIRTPNRDQKALHLSGGNQQKVVISKWLCSQSDILIFDEPTRGIDVGSKVEIYQLMNRLTADGAAIIMISSDLPEVLGMSDRILVMCRGGIAAEFTAEAATQEAILHKAIGEN